MAEWTWAAASRRGTSHEARMERRQDAFRIAGPTTGRRFLTVVACDGAGSASSGRQGAAVAAWTLASSARSWLQIHARLPEATDVAQWILLARLRILIAAAKRGRAARDFATTVVMAISDGTATLTAHIGDGAVVARDHATSAWYPLSWPEQGEYASTTYFLTDDGEPRLRVAVHLTRIDRLAVMTDGLERLALDFTTGSPHPGFFDAMFRPLAADGRGVDRPLCARLARYLGSESVNARTDDDKTLVLAACRR